MAPAADSQRGGPGRLTEEDLLSALPARSTNREVRVGVFVLVGLVAFFTMLFTFTDVGTFRGRYYATTVVADAGGMRRGDPVQMRGVNIGRVVGFDMVPRGVAVRLELYNEYPVPADSRATIESAGLLGGMVVNVIPGRSPERVDDEATIPAVTSSGIMETAEAVGTRADTALQRVNLLLSRPTINAVGQSAQELQGLLGELNALANEQRRELTALSASLRRSAAGMERVTADVGRATGGPELERSVQRIDSLTAQLAVATRNLNQASTSLETVVGRMERGEGTLGKLSTDEALYANLNNAATNLNALIQDIQQNPRRYINVRVF